MELVKGLPLTDYCDQRRLSVPDRLGLFADICQAVQHAHQKGIIHRDLKPGNVLVTEHDGRPVPKVIDFGLAKALHATNVLTDKTLHTAYGAVVGTPLYMAPEQVGINALDVDTRTDIYALGIMLYELLTGTTPLEKQQLKEAAWDEMKRLIRETDPPRPSQRLSSNAALPSLAANRRTEPRALTGLVRGEVDWIVMKALEKDRNRRYETAAGFAADVRRHLAGEPVLAVPPTVGYRLRKFVRRNRGVVVPTLAVMASVVLALVGQTVNLFQAKEAERRALNAEANERAERAKAEDERKAADEARKVAQYQLARVQYGYDMERSSLHREEGLFHLVAALRRVPAEFDDLRQFATTTCLIALQQKASLRHLVADIRDDRCTALSPDFRTVLTYGGSGPPRLWDPTDGRLIAELRHGPAPLMHCQYSADGRHVFTDDADGVVRTFDPRTGHRRAETVARRSRYSVYAKPTFDTGPRPEPFDYPVQSSGDRILTDSAEQGANRTGPVELWDATTGRRVALIRPHEPGNRIPRSRFGNDGTWVLSFAEDKAVEIRDAIDGRIAARVPTGDDDLSPEVMEARPVDSYIVIGSSDGFGRKKVYVWNRTTHRLVYRRPADEWRYPSDEVRLKREGTDYDALYGKVTIPAANLATLRQTVPEIADVAGLHRRVLPRDRNSSAVSRDGLSFDALPPPPVGRKYHPRIAELAPDGRYVVHQMSMIDVRTEMSIPAYFADRNGFTSIGYSPALGQFIVVDDRITLLPADPPAISADDLELAVKVALCGELGPDGKLVPWDEPTWERHRQQLAARPVALPTFPFPGLIATDRLRWIENERPSPNEDDPQRWAAKALRRATADGDAAAIVRCQERVDNLVQMGVVYRSEKSAGRDPGGTWWREENRPYRPTAPPPRPGK